MNVKLIAALTVLSALIKPSVIMAQNIENEIKADLIDETIIVIDDNPDESSPVATENTNVDGNPLAHFTWGVDAGSSIDLTGQELTSIDIDANFGYKNPIIDFLGVGATIKMMTINSSRAYPIYAMLRTSFSPTPTLCFWEMKAGVEFLNLHDKSSQTNAYIGTALGITLAKGKTFTSHITVGYEFTPIKNYVNADGNEVRMKDLHVASLKIGINF